MSGGGRGSGGRQGKPPDKLKVTSKTRRLQKTSAQLARGAEASKEYRARKKAAAAAAAYVEEDAPMPMEEAAAGAEASAEE